MFPAEELTVAFHYHQVHPENTRVITRCMGTSLRFCLNIAVAIWIDWSGKKAAFGYIYGTLLSLNENSKNVRFDQF
jgi:hypothetical protein